MEQRLQSLVDLRVDAPAPAVNPWDLRLNPGAEEIDDGDNVLMAQVEQDGRRQWIKQDAAGRQLAVDDTAARYTLPRRGHQPVIRIFMSSTFKDMQVERSHLIQTVFPRLKQLAGQHGIALQEIDLRWGVTAEQVRRGETVAICLEEIDRCRDFPPFFIGMLGERYGWVPEPAALDALDRQLAGRGNAEASAGLRQRARDHAMSVTEMEFRYGVLDQPMASRHALFYTRAPALTEQLALHGADGIAGYYDPAHEARQAALKAEIAAAGLIRIDGYRSVRELGEDIERMVGAAIVRLGRVCNSVRTQWAAPMPDGHDRNEEISRELSVERIALPGEEDGDWLHWLRGEKPGPRRLFLGPPGSGKCHLAFEESRGIMGPIFLHCRSGYFNDTTGAAAYLRGVLAAMGHAPPLQGPPRMGFTDVLGAIGARVLIVVTDIDLLADGRDLCRLLGTVDNPNLYFVLTASDSAYADAAAGFTVRHVAALDAEARHAFIDAYLDRFRKKLEPAYAARIVAMPLAGSPAFLRLLLDELRRDATFETLSGIIDAYAGMSTFEAACLHALDTWLRYVDEDGSHADAWKIVLGTLAVAPHGVPEAFFLAPDGAGLAPLSWSTWLGLASPILAQAGTGWRLRNPVHAGILRERYLDADAQRDALRRLSRFTLTDSISLSTRGIAEHADLLLRIAQAGDAAEDIQTLHAWMVKPDTASAVAAYNPVLMERAWRYLLQAGYPIDALLDDPAVTQYAAMGLFQLLNDFQAWPLLEKLARGVLASETPLAGMMQGQGLVEFQLAVALSNQGRVDEAPALIAPSLQAWMQSRQGLPPYTMVTLMSLATDRDIDLRAWETTLEAGLQALSPSDGGQDRNPSRDPGKDPGKDPDRLRYFLLLMAATVFLSTVNQPARVLEVAPLVIGMSEELPGPRGEATRLMALAETMTALSQMQRYQEAVELGRKYVDVGRRDDRQTELHGRCARIMAACLTELGQLNAALAALDFAWAHEAMKTANPAFPVLTSAGYVICHTRKGDQAAAKRWLDAFEKLAPTCPPAADAVMGAIGGALTLMRRQLDWFQLQQRMMRVLR